MKELKKALTFDDILLVPAHSEVLPKQVSLTSKLTELQLAVNNTQIQKDTSSRNWFIVGAIVLFFGMMIGFIVPGLLNRRRY